MLSIDQWLIEHPFFAALRSDFSRNAWAMYAEAAAPLIYTVPTFLGVTLARTDTKAKEILSEVWAEELGMAENLSHPVLFQKFHQSVTDRWGKYTHLQRFGVKAGIGMIELCSSGDWPIGVAAMLAHESQFPPAYQSMLAVAKQDLGDDSEFFDVHALVDVEHTATSTRLLDYAVSSGVARDREIEQSYFASAELLRSVFDGVWAEMSAGSGH
jgi:pyrroloquinoline quinone (PQQ) biosynthesis protein C